MNPSKSCKTKLTGLLIGALISIFSICPSGTGAAQSIQTKYDPAPDKADYENSPFMAVGSVIPHVLIVMAKNIKMFQHGYPGLVDLDGDGRVDTGFNPGVEYIGYFDPRSCYKYVGSDYEGLAQYNTSEAGKISYAKGDINGYFQRVGPTKDDQSESEIAAQRPASLKSYVVSPRSKTGICNDPTTAASSRNWSGNWLNYISTSRMDAVRKILYGGTRAVDSATQTILVGSFVPPDSTIWGTEVRSDSTWQEITPLNAYFDIRKYTVYDKPTGTNAHYIARGADLGANTGMFPAIRVLLNANKASFNIGGKDGVGVSFSVTEPYTRYWDWVLVNRALPDDQVLTENTRKTIKIYHVRVLACDKDNIGENEGCLRYPGATDSETDDVFKPGGLLQKYGQGSSPMYFGLITGGYNGNIRERGGKLRNHIGHVMGTAPGAKDTTSYVPAIDTRTGSFIEKGMIRNIDYLRISGRDLTKIPVGWPDAAYGNEYSWYNPLGEMVYEAARYLNGATSPTFNFANEKDSDHTGSSILNLTHFDTNSNSWNNLKPKLNPTVCFKPVILLISDITSDYDGDNMGSDITAKLLSNIELGGTGLTLSNVPNTFNNATYLNTITRLENLDTTGSRSQYYFSASETDTCSPKALTGGLGQVKGVCPSGQATEGTYSAAAVSYYAHIHNFNALSGSSEALPIGVDVYAVTMSSTFPELTFPVRNSSGSVVKTVSILPTNTSSLVKTGKQLLGTLNYFILEWDVDRAGLTFHAKIKVNFSDANAGGDWEGDGQVTYTVDLLTDSQTPSTMREATAASIDSGDPAIRTGKTYYKFKNPTTADATSDFIKIEESQVKAILIHSSWIASGTGAGLAMGYTITGTPRDGTYLDLTMNTPSAHDSLTPKDCPYLGGTTTGTYGCKKAVGNQKSQARVFAFRNTSSEFQALPNPLYLAAKYGGFNDSNHNAIPDPGEWEGPDGNPANYFQATNIAELPGKLEAAFQTIARSLTSSTATSASVDVILGGGISIQTAYYPEYLSPSDNTSMVNWVGTVYGLFVDKWGNLREDSDGDNKLTAVNGEDGNAGDYVVTFTSTKSPPANPPECYRQGEFITRCFTPYGNNVISFFSETYKRHPATIHRIVPLFDAGHWLATLSSAKLASASRSYTTPATASEGRRRIYFGDIPISPPGSQPTLALFDTSPDSLAKLGNKLLFSNYNDVLPGFASKAAATTALIQWIQGIEHPMLRNRTVADPWTGSGSPVVWRLGDVINSKPLIVGGPASNFDMLYGDASYNAYNLENATRRQMTYFGANDGMLHAVNLGFYGSLSAGQVSFTKKPIVKSGPEPTVVQHDIGAEVWAYIPPSLLPHLQWLASKSYTHAYYVDLKPLINDVKINGKWHTVLIGGLRLGGRPIEKPDYQAQLSSGNDPIYYSEVFCIDITDPESEPKLLWRYSTLEAGLSVGLPSTVSSDGHFYAVIPSGPVVDSVVGNRLELGGNSPYAGYSNQRARLIVIDFETGKEVGASSSVPNYLTVDEDNSFFNNPFLPIAQRRETPWTNHVLYYGLTVSRSAAHCEDSGGVYRLQMVDGDGSPLGVSSWKLKRFFDADRPVTGAVNSTYDPKGNLWVFFGTGRLWSTEDLQPCVTLPNDNICKTNHDQYIYGLKEPVNALGYLTFAEVPNNNRILDVSGATVKKNGNVEGLSTSLMATGPGGTSNFSTILAATTTSPTITGYKRKLDMGNLFYKDSGPHANEMVLTQPKLVAMGNGRAFVTYSSFEPTSTGCGSSGYGYLYLLNAFTGLADPTSHSYFYPPGEMPVGITDSELVLGGITAGVEGNPTEPYVQSSASGIKIGTNNNATEYPINIPAAETPSNSMLSWKEVLNMGFEIPKDTISKGLTTP